MHFHLVKLGVDELQSGLSAVDDLGEVLFGLEERDELFFVACLLIHWDLFCDFDLYLV